MSGAASNQTIIGSFAASSLCFTNHPIAPSTNSRTDCQQRRRKTISRASACYRVEFDNLVTIVEGTALFTLFCFRIPNGLLQELCSVHERDLEEAGGGQKRGRASSSEQPKRVTKIDRRRSEKPRANEKIVVESGHDSSL